MKEKIIEWIGNVAVALFINALFFLALFQIRPL
jgi:hypothetical protein